MREPGPNFVLDRLAMRGKRAEMLPVAPQCAALAFIKVLFVPR